MMTGNGRQAVSISIREVDIKHVVVDAPVHYETFIRSLERILGRFSRDVEPVMTSQPATARRRIEAMAGEQGLMIFTIVDHGAALNIVAEPRKARQYLIGNPLMAIRMTRWNLGAALYDPLRVLVHQRTDGATRIEYDLPSSLLDQFGSAEVIRVAVSLDVKLETLISRAAAGS